MHLFKQFNRAHAKDVICFLVMSWSALFVGVLFGGALLDLSPRQTVLFTLFLIAVAHAIKIYQLVRGNPILLDGSQKVAAACVLPFNLGCSMLSYSNASAASIIDHYWFYRIFIPLMFIATFSVWLSFLAISTIQSVRRHIRGTEL
jgi:hypothetical protein